MGLSQGTTQQGGGGEHSVLDLRIHSHWKERNNHPENYWGGKDAGPSWPTGKGASKGGGKRWVGRRRAGKAGSLQSHTVPHPKQPPPKGSLLSQEAEGGLQSPRCFF